MDCGRLGMKEVTKGGPVRVLTPDKIKPGRLAPPRPWEDWNSAHDGLQNHPGLSNFDWHRIRPALRLPARTFPSTFLYRRARRLSQGTANPFRATPMVRPLCLAEPGRGDAPCTTRALAVFFHPPYRPAGQPSGIRAFRIGPVRKPIPSFQRLRSFDRWVSINGDANLPLCAQAVKADYPHFIHKN